MPMETNKPNIEKNQMENFQILYSNFDKLQMAFKANFLKEHLDLLEETKKKAQETHEKELIFLNGVPVHVDEKGMQRYKYSFKTEEENIYFVNDSNKEDAYNLIIAISSKSFMLYGYSESIARIKRNLQTWGVEIKKEALSRVDFCVDFLVPDDFEIEPNNFIRHQNTSLHTYGKTAKIAEEPAEQDDTYIAYYGGKIETCTVGKMPNKQITIYNKTNEIKKRKKNEWYDVWKVKEGSRVFRVEIRAGKDYLKDYWNMRSFKDLEEMAGDMFLKLTQTIRYTQQATEKRDYKALHPIWAMVREQLQNVFSYSVNGLDNNKLKEVKREEKINLLNKHLEGLGTTLAFFTNASAEKVNQLRNFIQRVFFNNTNGAYDYQERAFKAKVERAFNHHAKKYYFLNPQPQPQLI
jgi:hypothetical protein